LLGGNVLENETLNEMHLSLIKHFLDLVVLAELRRSGSLSGYDILRFIHGTYDILISPGTVYSLLYSLERKKIVIGEWTEGRRAYSLTEKGEKTIATVSRSKGELLRFVENLLES
jgi:DNA-binding PadR family transcriptional regulator